MRISIATPSFNQGKFIEETIKSILSQDYRDIEYIVVDGGSTDRTIDILKKYDGKIKWISEKDKGQSDAINKGMKMATGEILAFINSDDLMLPGTLSSVADIFKKNKKVSWITGDYHIINAKGKKIRRYVCWYKRFLRLFSSYGLLTFANYIVQPSTFWRRKVMERVGLFDVSLPYEMDYDYWLRVGKKYKLHIIEKPLSLFRLHDESKSGYQYKNQFMEEIKVLKKHKISRLMTELHRIHNKIIIFLYNLIVKFEAKD
jgi:glycosyltransferase involved in cell wall biosynthesis